MKKIHKGGRSKTVAVGALALAAAFLLSCIKISAFWSLGGSITLFSMVPIVALSFWYGYKQGALVGFCLGLLKLATGSGNFVCVEGIDVVASMLLDYLLAYSVVGLAPVFRIKKVKKRTLSVCICIFFVFLIRFLCHFVSGIILWTPLVSKQTTLTHLVGYCAAYNILYLVPEMGLTMLGSCAILFRWPALWREDWCFGEDKIKR